MNLYPDQLKCVAVILEGLAEIDARLDALGVEAGTRVRSGVFIEDTYAPGCASLVVGKAVYEIGGEWSFEEGS